jgi:hypothetical protein
MDGVEHGSYGAPGRVWGGLGAVSVYFRMYLWGLPTHAFRACCMPLPRAGAGMCARRRTYLLLLRQKKVGQEKTTPLPVSPSPEGEGAACDARSWGAPRNSLRSPCGRTPFRHLRRVRSRSVCVLRHTRHPSSCASRHGQKGVDTETGHCFARPWLPRCAWPCRAIAPTRRQRAARNRHPAQLRRQQAPLTPLPPLLAAPRSAGHGVGACAEGHTHFVI